MAKCSVTGSANYRLPTIHDLSHKWAMGDGRGIPLYDVSKMTGQMAKRLTGQVCALPDPDPAYRRSSLSAIRRFP